MRYVVIDLETTGIDYLEEYPIQMAWEAFNDKFMPMEQGMIYIKPPKPIPQFITELTGITQEKVDRHGVSLPGAGRIYNDLIWRYNPTMLLGYNIIAFDLPFIQITCQKNIPKKFKHPPLVAVVDVMFLYCANRGKKGWPKLADAAKEVGVSFEATELHDARADVTLTWELYKKIRGK